MMNIEGFGFLGFQFVRKEKCRKVSEMCVIDIYSDFVKSFHIKRGQNGHLIND